MSEPSSEGHIRNSVAFEAYADIDVATQGAIPGALPLVMSQCMQAVHGAIVEGLSLAVAFPLAKPGPEKTIGGRLRVFGPLSDVGKFVSGPMIAGLSMARLLSISGPSPVPNGVTDGISYLRSRPDKLLPGTWDRMDRRARVRRKTGRGFMDEDDIARRREVLAERAKDALVLPSFMLSSATTSQRYPIYVASRPGSLSGNKFTSYGLSDGDGAVPAF